MTPDVPPTATPDPNGLPAMPPPQPPTPPPVAAAEPPAAVPGSITAPTSLAQPAMAPAAPPAPVETPSAPPTISTPPPQPAPAPAPMPAAPAATPMPAPTLVPTPPVSPGELATNGKKTLGLLHRYEPLVRVVVIVLATAFIITNGLLSWHIKVVRHKAYEDQGWVKAAQAQASFGPSLENRPDGTLDMSRRISSTYAIQNQTITAKVGQQVNLSNGMSFIITKVQKNWAGAQDPPFNGESYTLLTVTIGNRGNQPLNPDFGLSKIKAGDKVEEDGVYFPSDGDQLGSQTNLTDFNLPPLQPGSVLKNGALIIQAPVNSPLTLQFINNDYGYTPGEHTNYADKQITMEADVSLQ